MRKSATGSSYRCRLIALLLILLDVFKVDTLQVSTYYKPDLGIGNSTFPDSHLEPTVYKRYYILSRCSEMYVRIKLNSKRNSVDASGKMHQRFTSIIMWSVGPNGRVKLQGEDSKKYLCFSNKGKLRSRHQYKERNCKFIYNVTEHGYHQFRLDTNTNLWYIGFKLKKLRKSPRGKALPGYKKIRNSRLERCYDFKLTPVDLPEPTPKPYSPIDFNKLGQDWDPSRHPIRHEQLKQGHRKNLRRRRKLRHSKKRKRDGS